MMVTKETIEQYCDRFGFTLKNFMENPEYIYNRFGDDITIEKFSALIEKNEQTFMFEGGQRWYDAYGSVDQFLTTTFCLYDQQFIHDVDSGLGI